MATVNKDFRVKNGLIVEGSTATVNGNDILTTASTIGTDSLSEGTTNLFFTEARALTAVRENLSINDLSDVSGAGVTNASVGDVLLFNGEEWEAQAITQLANTDELSEGTTNLYFTDARARAALVGQSISPLQVNAGTSIVIDGGQGDITIGGASVLTENDLLANTDELSEGTTNLYFTDDRAVSAVEGAILSNLTVDSITLDGHTAQIGEITINGAGASISGLQIIDGAINVTNGLSVGNESVATQAFVSTAVSNLIDAAPGALDTLNELAAAIGDDPNFATTVTNLINNLDTDGVTEGTTNLYFTDERARAALGTGQTSSANISNLIVGTLVGIDDSLNIGGSVAVANGLTVGGEDVLTTSDALANTDELSEGTTNLYFTDARAVSAIDGSTLTSLNTGTLGYGYAAISTAEYIVAQSATQAVANMESSSAVKLIINARNGAGERHISEVLAVVKNSDIYITEYASIATDADLYTVSATGYDIELTSTGANSSGFGVVVTINEIQESSSK